MGQPCQIIQSSPQKTCRPEWFRIHLGGRLFHAMAAGRTRRVGIISHFGGHARPMRTLRFLSLCVLILPDAIAQSTCGNVQLQLTPDYGLAVGNSTGGGAYTLT